MYLTDTGATVGIRVQLHLVVRFGGIDGKRVERLWKFLATALEDKGSRGRASTAC